MRITIPVSGDGDAWMSHSPSIEVENDDVILPDGKLNLPRVIEVFRDANAYTRAHGFGEMFSFSADDGYNVFLMALEFLVQLGSVTRYLEGRADCTAHLSADGSARDARLEKRMSRGQVAYCRVDVRNTASGVAFVVDSGNPRQRVIGNCEKGAREFAVFVLRVLLNLADRINDSAASTRARLTVSVRSREEGLVDYARAREAHGRRVDQVAAINARRERCASRQGEYCSPLNPACECCQGGRCVALPRPMFEG